MTSGKPSLKSTNRGMTQPRCKFKRKSTHKHIGTISKNNSITIDRISKFPDHLLHHILSVLPLKQVACTSVLSHRWRNVWASMQGLKFYTDEFVKYGQRKFISYVNAALPYRLKQDFQEFRTILFNASLANLAASTQWINHAVMNDVRVLHIILRRNNSDGNMILPRSMLTSQTLEELALFSFPGLKIITPTAISMSQLKKLSLQRVGINSAFMEKIISGCPGLEDLNLHYCGVTCSGISSKVLRNLVIEKCGIQIQKFYICMPNLVHLRFSQGYIISSVNEEVDEMNYRLFKADLQNLKLDVPNLKSLTLGEFWVPICLDAVPLFLQCTPMLEKLTLICIEGSEYWTNLKPVETSTNLRFRCRNLKSVKLMYHDSDKLIRHLTEVLKSNGVSNLNITRGERGDLDDCFNMFYPALFWINEVYMLNS